MVRSVTTQNLLNCYCYQQLNCTRNLPLELRNLFRGCALVSKSLILLFDSFSFLFRVIQILSRILMTRMDIFSHFFDTRSECHQIKVCKCDQNYKVHVIYISKKKVLKDEYINIFNAIKYLIQSDTIDVIIPCNSHFIIYDTLIYSNYIPHLSSLFFLGIAQVLTK